MPNNNPTDNQKLTEKEVLKLLKKGDDQEVERVLVDNFHDLSEDLKLRVMTYFFERDFKKYYFKKQEKLNQKRQALADIYKGILKKIQSEISQ
jgi:hypothetical protein